MPLKSTLRADFHIHSHFSPDGDMAPEKIVEAAGRSGLDVIAVTDHNSIKGGLEVKKLAKDLIVFVGSEIKTDRGEIIALNLNEDITPRLPLEKACELAKKQNAFIIVPHPFDRFRNGIGKDMEKVLKYIDAVEVFNARTLVTGFNKRALEFAERHSLPCVAGSDAHFRPEIGSARMLIESSRSEKDILSAIRKGHVEIVGRKTGLKPHWNTFARNVRKIF